MNTEKKKEMWTLGELKIAPNKDKTKYKVLENFQFFDILVPTGFEFDGASVPRFFWRIVSPFQPKVIRAACGHDYMYEHAIQNKKQADKKFKWALVRDGTSNWLVHSMYKSVVMFGKGRYN